MSNPLFQQYGNQLPSNYQNMMQKFKQFQQAFHGNPQQMVQQMLNSGRITQEQFNNAAQIANQMMRYMK